MGWVGSGHTKWTHGQLCKLILWSELSRRKLSPTLATAHYSCPDNDIGLVAQCELSSYVILESVGRKFSHRPGNPATDGVVRWPSAGDTAGYRLRRPKLTPVSLISMVSADVPFVQLWCCWHSRERTDRLQVQRIRSLSSKHVFKWRCSHWSFPTSVRAIWCDDVMRSGCEGVTKQAEWCVTYNSKADNFRPSVRLSVPA